MARSSVRSFCLIALVLGTGACTAIVGGKLDKLPEGDDAGTARCTPGAMCDDRNACNGVDLCGPGGLCMPGMMVVADGAPCDTDGTAATPEICVMGTCHAPRCGDRVVTRTGMFPEECDDGANANDNDGCKNNCKFTCQLDSDCDDGNLCDGREACTIAAPGMRMCREDLLPLPPDGSDCTKPDGNPGTCMGTLCT